MSKKKTSTTSKPTIDDVLKLLNKKYEGDTYKGSELERPEKITTGSLIFDKYLDGGYVPGKFIECYGKESLGKTALGYTMLSKMDGVNVYIDGESTYDRETAKMYGVNVDNLIVRKPEYLEEALEMLIELVAVGVDGVVFDSIAGFPTKGELEGSMEDHSIGKKASRMGQLFRKLHKKADKSGTTCYFINQLRQSMEMFSAKYTVPGGEALKFHATYRFFITSKEDIKKGEEVIGHYMKIKITKNKLGKSGEKFKIPLMYGYGVSREWEILDLAIENKIIKKSGSWFSYEGTNLAQGQYNTWGMLIDNPEFTEELLTKIKI